jgi:hypothetical protein
LGGWIAAESTPEGLDGIPGVGSPDRSQLAGARANTTIARSSWFIGNCMDDPEKRIEETVV